MKVTDLNVSKQTIDGIQHLTCTLTYEDGSTSQATAPWINDRGLWASKEDARDPAEISAWLRNFARAIDEYVQAKAA